MKNTSAIILLFVFGKVISQNNCKDPKENYNPKNPEDKSDDIKDKRIFWRTKAEIKNNEERDTLAKLFGSLRIAKPLCVMQ